MKKFGKKVISVCLLVMVSIMCICTTEADASTRSYEHYETYYQDGITFLSGHTQQDNIHYNVSVTVRYFTSGAGTTTAYINSFSGSAFVVGPNSSWFDVDKVTCSPTKGSVLKNDYATVTLHVSFPDKSGKINIKVPIE